MKITAKKIAVIAVMCAMSLIMYMVEMLFPPIFLAGTKMGLANIFSLLTLLLFGLPWAILVVVVRTTLGSLITGSLSSLMYSLSGGLVAILVAGLLLALFKQRLSIISLSIASATAHNLTQNTVFCLITETPEMFAYMPYLAILSVIFGLVVGFAVLLIIKIVPTKTFAKIYDNCN